uniref:non-specific serine/threonine protein kinase n=1 Tax=Aegilops tauschii subsp. strangulata TaxID=200361 RepID=A0A452XU80_AEGTS
PPMPPAMATLTTTSPPLLLLISIIILLLADAGAVRFDYATLTLATLKLLGDAHLNNNTIRLTRDLPVPTSASGRALYAAPVRLLAGFSTSFAFTVTTLNRGSVGGGLAFVVAPDAASVGDGGAFLGLDPAADVAVEFDTLMDLQFGDVNGNHVGVDLGSMVSVAVADLDLAGVELTSGRTVYAWIEYAPGKAMDVFVSYSSKRPPAPVLSATVDLAGYVKEQAFVGFSASTQGSTEIHAIEWWSFSTPSPPSPAPSKPPPVSARKRDAVAVATKRDNVASAAAMARSPREFSYKELSAATRGFDASRVIGNGAFGVVYKGIVPDTGAMVAVKRCTNANADGAQARAEFLSELSIIAGLRHRNLLRLQGWCYEKGEILLVYDYMRNGSLDRTLFDASSPALPWRHRHEILAGVASALAYLHHECDRRVIHRDVKSSNVMLDESYRARLGDFGLARQAEHGASPDATAAAGTMGYLAPEYMLTGRATEATDVFSFGALVLEVACGRRPIGTEGRCNNLVEWVWSLHGEARVLDAVDPRLGGDYDEGEMRRVLLVGLACSSPEPDRRPGMRAVVQMLSGEADPPFVPAARPSMSFSANHQLLLSLQDSVSDYNALGLNLSDEDSSSDSLSSSSLTSTLRKGGHDIGFSSTAGGDAR